MEHPIDRNSLIESHMPYTKRLAKKMYSKNSWIGVDLPDVVSAAYYGLCDAAWRYDARESTNFQTFSYMRVRGAVYDAMRVEFMHNNSRSARARSAEPPVKPARTANELRDLLNILPDQMVKLHVNPVEDGVAMTDISYINDQSPEERFYYYEARRLLHALIAKLPEKEQLIIKLYYFEELGFDEMRKHFKGASRSWLCRLHRRALDRLKKLIFTRSMHSALL